MKSLPLRNVLAHGAALIVALTFAFAAVPKLLDPGSFAGDILNYRVLPEALVGHAALYVPAFELVVAGSLLWPRYQRGAALLSLLMLLVFAGAMAQARVRGIDLSCGCFGAAFESKVSWWTVTRSSLLALIAAVPLFWPPLSAAAPHPLTSADPTEGPRAA